MTSWMIELDGERFDLQELLKLNSLPGITITDESGRFYLRSDEFNSCAEARDVLDRGTEILRVVDGIAQLEIQNWDNVRVKGVARAEANGSRTQFLFPEAIRGRSRMSGTATIIRADGTVDSSVHKSTLESFLEIAQKDTDVEKALRILGSGRPRWSSLYNIYEIIEHNIGGAREVVQRGWSSKSKIRNFKHTADSVSAAGDDARHGKEETTPPPSPMPLSEAESLVRNLLKNWLRSK